jgi:pyruvate/2-oxoglutarate dehydrogenase complex dihydrolipoamide dehydrogenase (E3) component
MVRDLGADFVVVATGAVPYVPDIEVLGRPALLSAEAVLYGAALTPGHVLVVDAASDWVGAGVARLLRERGHRVTLATSGVAPGEALQQYVCDQQIINLAHDHVEVQVLTRLQGVDDDTAYLEHVLTGDRSNLGPLSGVVTTGWRRPCDELSRALEAASVAHVGVGDCLAPRTVEEAVLEGLRAARAFELA